MPFAVSVETGASAATPSVRVISFILAAMLECEDSRDESSPLRPKKPLSLDVMVGFLTAAGRLISLCLDTGPGGGDTVVPEGGDAVVPAGTE